MFVNCIIDFKTCIINTCGWINLRQECIRVEFQVSQGALNISLFYELKKNIKNSVLFKNIVISFSATELLDMELLSLNELHKLAMNIPSSQELMN